jgi:hypothetical protein
MTLTIEITSADEQRVTTAFGGAAPATQAEMTAYVKQWLGQTTINYERNKAMEDYESPPLGLMA